MVKQLFNWMLAAPGKPANPRSYSQEEYNRAIRGFLRDLEDEKRRADKLEAQLSRYKDWYKQAYSAGYESGYGYGELDTMFAKLEDPEVWMSPRGKK